jgi:hypothetical protein
MFFTCPNQFVLLCAALCLCSCAAPRTAPRFDAPSTASIKASTEKARQHVGSARKTVQIISQAPEISANPVLELKVQSLGIDLDNALSALDTTEGARQQLDTQVKTQTDKANALARDYDKASLTIISLKESRHRWVTFFTGSLLVNVAAIGWIFRKPIMLLIAGI